ncbi:hypothetical protein [Priestia megaterium]|uniref:hypothetical protein n=1 Tax=Priestia megaterium TaxID=1404 RepID=UPI00237A80A5|nr:hypothetical protein [Priestia megaterium]MDD9791736.1 hypothetical protein [Priestia megaterium]
MMKVYVKRKEKKQELFLMESNEENGKIEIDDPIEWGILYKTLKKSLAEKLEETREQFKFYEGMFDSVDIEIQTEITKDDYDNFFSLKEGIEKLEKMNKALERSNHLLWK